MSLDIRIKENKKIVHNCNFYGFMYFSDFENRTTKAKELLKENPVNDKKTFIEFIKKSVDTDRQQIYFDLIKNEKSNVTVDIY